MFPSVAKTLFTFLACFASAIPAENNTAIDPSHVDIITVDDISKFKDLADGAKLIELVPSSIREIDAGTPQARVSIQYIWGKRVSGDLWISQASDTYKYDSPHDVKVSVEYPGSGVGAIVTYVQVEVIQTKNNGRAYIIAGGIGQRKFAYVMEAYETRVFYFSSKMFGIK